MNDIHHLSSREFEVLAANYAKHIFPKYEWKITKAIGDYNRDFEAILNSYDKWGEAKLTKNQDTSVSKGRWDPTLLSAVLKNNVDELILVTSGWIPLEYIVRACHFVDTASTIRKIYFINGFLINEWLKIPKGLFSNFDIENINLNEKHISYQNIKTKSKCSIQVFDMFNILEPKYELFNCCPYKIYITFFVASESTVAISVPDWLEIKNIKTQNLSAFSEMSKLENINNEKKALTYKCNKGYNQIIVSGVGAFKDDLNNNQSVDVYINSENVQSNKIKIILPSEIDSVQTEMIAAIEKERNLCIINNNNSVIDVAGISRNDVSFISSNNQCFYYFSFGKSFFYDAIELCRFFSLLAFGVYDGPDDNISIEKAVNSTLNYCPTSKSNILIGMSDYIYAADVVKDLSGNSEGYIFKDFNVASQSVIYIDISNDADTAIFNILNTQLNLFKSASNASLVILNKSSSAICCPRKLQHQENIDLLDSIKKCDIISENQKNELLKIAKKYYEKSDFLRAKFYYEILFDKCETFKTELFTVFNYADCLNHCNSMNRSKELFASITQMSANGEPEREKKILEAYTELFNIRFWCLDVSDLVSEINGLLKKHANTLLMEGSPRALYAYYNCLNRKMVTQYLIGEYDNAEDTFKEYINSIKSDNYKNYLAFAYMDSARGLYAHNIKVAGERLAKADAILSKISKTEQRRYLDCKVETEYVTFICDYENNVNCNIQPLENAITEIRMKGYKSMLIKCNLKLAACYLALNDLEKCGKSLEYVKGSCDFSNNPRVEMMYNNLLSIFYAMHRCKVAEKYLLSDDYQIVNQISFNINSINKFIIDPRLW